MRRVNPFLLIKTSSGPLKGDLPTIAAISELPIPVLRSANCFSLSMATTVAATCDRNRLSYF